MLVSRRGLIVIPTLAFVTAVSVAATRPPTSPCEATNAWADANFASVPHTYDGLAALDMGKRRAIYARLSRDEKVAVWQRQLTDRFGHDTTLTTEQRAYVDTLMARLSIYLDGQEGRRLAKVDLMEHKSVQLFGRERATELFAQLGPKDAANEKAKVAGFSDCNCVFGAEITGCGDLSGSCTSPSCAGRFACGWLNCAWCDGLCQY